MRKGRIIMYSSVKRYNGVPTLFVNDRPITGFAYITYRTNEARYDDFNAIGCRLYSLPVFFGGQTINETSQIPPIAPGIFDSESPDFSSFDLDIERIISSCPEAMIFPRVNLSLPERWERENPEECCDFSYREHHRACFSSELWAAETKRLLKLFIDHVERAEYREHIIGYQLAAGNTEEWFPFDMRGSVGKSSRERFFDYCREKGISGDISDERAFYSEVIAERIIEFAAFAKEITGRRLVIGCFYGYTLECTDPLLGHHALRRILACDEVDFICSPVSYAELRPIGQDHSCMLPIDSLKLHNKLYFVENDTRTHLSKAPNTLPQYNTPIWFGPSAEKTREIMLMHFSRALTHGHAMWWFDMWGGWFADDSYLSLLTELKGIADRSLNLDRTSGSEVAVFIDERVYSSLSYVSRMPYNIRKPLGLMGTPYDIYLIDDYEAVKDSYKAYIFLCPDITERVELAIADAGERAIVLSEEESDITAGELRELCRQRGVHIWSDSDAVVYVCQSYVFVHSIDGAPSLKLPEGCRLVKLTFDKLIESGHSEPSLGQLYRLEKQKK